MDDWVQRIKTWVENGAEEIYFFSHQSDETYTPKTCAYMIEQLNKHCGLNLEAPEFIA